MFFYSTKSFLLTTLLSATATSFAFQTRPSRTGFAGTLKYRSDADVDISSDSIVHLDVAGAADIDNADLKPSIYAEFDEVVSDKNKAPWHANSYKKWGIANDSHKEYWFDSRIHTLGNTGFMGGVHAAIAPLSTKMIDNLAYEGVNVREMVATRLYDEVGKSHARVLDLACGVGTSTRALLKAFPDAEAVIGIDTSKEMIAMAQAVSKHVNVIRSFLAGFVHIIHYMGLNHHFAAFTEIASTAYNKVEAAYIKANAESTALPDDSFDLTTVMYAFHEAPPEGRRRIIREAHRVLKDGGILALIDISPDYVPKPAMLAGEPYVLEYLKNINEQVLNMEGFTNVIHEVLVPGHVSMWRLTCDKQSKLQTLLNKSFMSSKPTFAASK